MRSYIHIDNIKPGIPCIKVCSASKIKYLTVEEYKEYIREQMFNRCNSDNTQDCINPEIWNSLHSDKESN